MSAVEASHRAFGAGDEASEDDGPATGLASDNNVDDPEGRI